MYLEPRGSHSTDPFTAQDIHTGQAEEITEETKAERDRLTRQLREISQDPEIRRRGEELQKKMGFFSLLELL